MQPSPIYPGHNETCREQSAICARSARFHYRCAQRLKVCAAASKSAAERGWLATDAAIQQRIAVGKLRSAKSWAARVVS